MVLLLPLVFFRERCCYPTLPDARARLEGSRPYSYPSHSEIHGRDVEVHCTDIFATVHGAVPGVIETTPTGENVPHVCFRGHVGRAGKRPLGNFDRSAV